MMQHPQLQPHATRPLHIHCVLNASHNGISTPYYGCTCGLSPSSNRSTITQLCRVPSRELSFYSYLQGYLCYVHHSEHKACVFVLHVHVRSSSKITAYPSKNRGIPLFCANLWCIMPIHLTHFSSKGSCSSVLDQEHALSILQSPWQWPCKLKYNRISCNDFFEAVYMCVCVCVCVCCIRLR